MEEKWRIQKMPKNTLLNIILLKERLTETNQMDRSEKKKVQANIQGD
jgi:hypothetical protein